MTINALLYSAAPAEAIDRLVEIRKSHWIESQRKDAGEFRPTQEYLDAGMEILKAYRPVLAFELGFGPGTDNERQNSYRAWADGAKSPAELALRLTNLLMSQIDRAFHEQLSRQFEFVPSHITLGDTEMHWWMNAMREAGLHAGQFVERDANGAGARCFCDPESGALPADHLPTDAARIGEAFRKLCRAAGETTAAMQGLSEAPREIDPVAEIVDAVLSHAAEHDYTVDSLDMALTGIDEAMNSLDIRLTTDEIQLAADRLLAEQN